MEKQGDIMGKFSALTNKVMDKDALIDRELVDLFELHRVAMEYNHFNFILNEKYE